MVCGGEQHAHPVSVSLVRICGLSWGSSSAVSADGREGPPKQAPAHHLDWITLGQLWRCDREQELETGWEHQWATGTTQVVTLLKVELGPG